MEKQRKTQNVRRAKPKRLPKKTWLQEAEDNQRKILAARGGEVMPDTTEIIRELREGRSFRDIQG